MFLSEYLTVSKGIIKVVKFLILHNISYFPEKEKFITYLLRILGISTRFFRHAV